MESYEDIIQLSSNVNDKHNEYVNARSKIESTLTSFKYLLDNPKDAFVTLELKNDIKDINELNVQLDNTIKSCKNNTTNIESLIEEYVKLQCVYDVISKKRNEKKMNVMKYE